MRGSSAAALAAAVVALAMAGRGCGSDTSGNEPEQPGDASMAPDATSENRGGDETRDASDAQSNGADAGVDAADAESGGGCDGGVVAAPSCAPGGAGMTNCGAGGDGGGSESCCASLCVIGGTYDRTYANNGDGGMDAGDPASVSSFRLDKYEVTVGRFRQFVNAVYPPDSGTGWTPPAGSGKHTHLNGGQGLAFAPNVDAGQIYESGWDPSSMWASPANANLSCDPAATWTSSPAGNDNLPINCLDWNDAYAFCIWDGGFLPSAAEWEYTAAGGAELREYPWGSAALGTACPGTGCSYAIYGCYYPNGSGSCSYDGGVWNIAPAGTATLGAGKWGQLDLAGNMGEWNLDTEPGAYLSPCIDCAFLESEFTRVSRFGSYGAAPWWLHPWIRGMTGATDRVRDLGVRCARTP